MLVIDIPDGPDVEFLVALGEDVATLRLRWNARAASWYLDVADADGVPILSGQRLAVNMRVGAKSAHPFFAKHMIVAIDTSGERRDPGLDDLGRRVLLTWTEAGGG